MIAFVLSGAGNRGPLEAGALKALFEAGIQPAMLVGTSAGAINSSYVAAHGATVATANAIADLWAQADKDTVYPGNLVSVSWRLLTKQESLYNSDGMRSLVRNAIPSAIQSYAQLKIPLYVTATDLSTSRLIVFGAADLANTPVVDTVLASASMPPIHPPVVYHDAQLVDGGVVANVPAEIAMTRGATEVYVLNATYGGGTRKPVNGVLEVLGRTLNTMIAQSLFEDLDRADADPSINLHHIHLNAFQDISFRDFSKTREMVDAGYRIAQEYLAAPRPRGTLPAATPAAATAQPLGDVVVPGGQEYVPQSRRR